MVPVPTRTQVGRAIPNLEFAADYAKFARRGYEPTINTHQMLVELNTAATALGFALVPLNNPDNSETP